jgi:hypothetical protein
MPDTSPVKRLLGWVAVTVALIFSSALCALGVSDRTQVAVEAPELGARPEQHNKV